MPHDLGDHMTASANASRLSVSLAILALAAAPAFAAGSTNDAPPLPLVQSVTPLGLVLQNPVVNARDNAESALFRGKSIWTFGDTSMSVPGARNKFWDDNSLAWTTNLDASGGITLDHDLVDATGAPREFLPLTQAEARYNYTHDKAHCTAKPCGAELALWAQQVVPDEARNRLLLFYVEIRRINGQPDWKTVGAGIAVMTPDGKVTRPIQNPGSTMPQLLWDKGDGGYIGGSVVVADMLYSYKCVPDWVVMECNVGRVPLANVLDKSQWRYYAADGSWSANEADAVTVFQGGAAGNSVFYNAYLGAYMAIYAEPFTDNIRYRVADNPWGPWSDAGLLFTGEPGWNGTNNYAAFAHPEFSTGNGQVQYVTYVHTTGFLQQEIPLTKVVFQKP
ncbi:DUF4185 domain-containing protein [Pseudoluteimonas lycopersici]|uniref:DUF4185 domain-containing protein n=2 Tax=Pseudoluteimonas lycopersici TaxID=1324796 RepID=A0A516V465_9GAMM|nr:DUF4185 domain-containing protein [Lysobacter lycopersici]